MDVRYFKEAALRNNIEALDKVRLVSMCYGVELPDTLPTFQAVVALATDSDKVVGFVLGDRPGVGDVRGLWVEPSYRHGGVATEMLSRAYVDLDSFRAMDVAGAMSWVRIRCSIKADKWNRYQYFSPCTVQEFPGLTAIITKVCKENGIAKPPVGPSVRSYVTIKWGTIAGFVLWTDRGLVGLWVHPDMRKEGVGSTLLPYATEELNDAVSIPMFEAVESIYKHHGVEPPQDEVPAKFNELVKIMKGRGGLHIHDVECDMTLFIKSLSAGLDGYHLYLTHYDPEQEE